jgi:uncharacterized protein with NRDE domain
MCTIVMLVGVHADYPVLVAANRDEFYAREATAPLVLLESTRAVGGRDLRAGGTWMGVNAHGLFVGLTNQRTWSGPAASKRSRGDVPLGVLACSSRDEAENYLRSLDAREFNEFNLVYGDASGLRCAYARGASAAMMFEDVPPGVHVLPNDVLDAPLFAKAARAATSASANVRALAAARADMADLAPLLRDVVANHERAPLDSIAQPPTSSPFSRELVRELDAVCIHTPTYGTRSSTIAALAPGRVAHYLFASGPPCTTPFDDFTALLTADARSSS